MRTLGLVLILVVALLVAGWLALLRLPDAPRPRPSPPIDEVVAAEATQQNARREAGPLLAVPVAGVVRAAITDSWGDPRENGLRAHHGTDIIAPGGSPVTAAAPGVVEKLFQSAKGGVTLYVRSPRRIWTYYYAHLSSYAAGLHEGQAVRTGDPLGYVGDTGDAGAGNYHLHFGLTRTAPDQHWYEGTDVNPFPYLTGRRVAGSVR